MPAAAQRRRILTGIVAVLAVAGVAFVLRGALTGNGAGAPALPATAAARATAKAQTFALADLTRNVIPRGASTIATARRRTVRTYARPGAGRFKPVRQRLFERQRIPLTFLVVGRRKGWVHVALPTRPNQSRAWVRRHDVRLSFTQMRIEVQRSKHRLRLLDGRRAVFTKPIAVGKSLSPTPAGRYFVTDIIRATHPKGFFGPYALGLSAHSTVYTSFEGGDGQVGIHGTNQPAVLGSDVSHGCIRVGNAVIRRLAATVPLGTPVLITS